MDSTSADTRIGDIERERVRHLLQRHAGDGRLTLDELSDRLGEVYAARTAADLDHALRELPSLQRASQPPQPARRARGNAQADLLRFVSLAVALLGIWAFFALTTTATYFWPVWPIAFLGLKAARRYRAATGRAAWGQCGRAQRV
jgi:hypothetical protein